MAESHIHFSVVVNLALDGGGASARNIALHISIRYKEHVVVLNSMTNGEWALEERHKLPFKAGDAIDLRVRALEHKFEVGDCTDYSLLHLHSDLGGTRAVRHLQLSHSVGVCHARVR